MEAALIGGGFTFVFCMMIIIYNALNKGIIDNKDDIKNVKEKYVTKEDFNRQNDKVDAKLDKILDILMKEGRK